jgi:magnesium transporter
MLDPITKGYIALHPAAVASALAQLGKPETTALFEVMPRQLAANVMEHMVPRAAAQSLEQLASKISADLLARMPVPAAVEILRMMKREQVKTLFAAMPRSAVARLRMRLRFSETVIGGFVDTDVATITADIRVSDALRLIKRNSQRTGHTIYVLDEQRRLAGLVDLSELVAARERVMIQRLIRPAPVVFNARAPLQTAANHPGWLTHDNLPVINREGVFQGVLQRSTVMGEESDLINRVDDHKELSVTRDALADILWLGVSAIFSGSIGRATGGKVDD